MQKIYVLLRNDRQTGPYSLEEIIQFDLKPYDLIWIQGGSAGWYYPQEIAALHPYLSFLPKKQAPAAEAKPPFVAAPSASQPVETSRAASSFSSYPLKETAAKAATSTSPAALEEAVFAQFRERPEKAETVSSTQAATPVKKKQVNSAVVGLTTILIVGGVFAASWILNRKDSIAAETPMEMTADLPAPAEIAGTANNPVDPKPTTPSSTPPVRRNTSTGAKANKTTITSVPVSVGSSTGWDDPVREIAGNPGLEKEPPVVQSNEEVSEDANSENAAPVEKKKKLRDKIFDLFKKKPETSRQEEAGSAEKTTGERTASRRDESANLAQMVHVRFTVPNEWMMGIHGARATLVNRSNETIQKATVEVQYFDDDNQLLQKKTISFEKVGGKDSKTISIPDHPTATKVDYSGVAVSGKPAA
ncbi:MAG TPA: hypothetical protein VGN63_13555 [Flavisolibacter sp.]|jgi:hypothetical protein|nr:hypothetical protein [Flavisolibacter sp.]